MRLQIAGSRVQLTVGSSFCPAALDQQPALDTDERLERAAHLVYEVDHLLRRLLCGAVSRLVGGRKVAWGGQGHALCSSSTCVSASTLSRSAVAACALASCACAVDHSCISTNSSHMRSCSAAHTSVVHTRGRHAGATHCSGWPRTQHPCGCMRLRSGPAGTARAAARSPRWCAGTLGAQRASVGRLASGLGWEADEWSTALARSDRCLS
jgi:hypothetical protein